MCKELLNVRSLNYYGVKRALVPCGHCEECRKKNQKDWTTRLKSELEFYHFKRGYKVGFITLTYNDIHLPHVPRRFFKPGDYRRIPCFSYIDIKRFTDGIRNYLFRVHGLTDGYRFFLSSEYGEKKHRPHYHAILMWHPSISHETMYNVCSDLWCGSELVIPNNPKHKKKRRHYGIVSPFKDFVPRDNYSVGSYVAKYVCKDLEFVETVGDSFSHLTKRQKNRLRWFMPFHKQSRAFGACALFGKTDSECCDLLLNGLPFHGTRYRVALPRYLREKLLITTQKRYDVNSHREQTVRKYSKFFTDYRHVVYAQKVESFRERFKQLSTSEYWKNRKSEDFSRYVSDVVHFLGLDNLAWFSVLYYGVPRSRCHVLPCPEDAYLARFDPCSDLSDFPLIDSRFYGVFSRAIAQIDTFDSCIKIPPRSAIDKVISQVRAFYQVL